MAAKTASAPQIALINRLAGEKNYSSGQLDRVLSGETVSMPTASTLITELIAAPNNAAHGQRGHRNDPGSCPACHAEEFGETPTERPSAPSQELTPGMYKVDGVVYQVRPNQQKTRLYAKRLVEINADRITEDDEIVQIEFEYDRGAVFQIKPEHRMPLEEGKALCIRYGRCICCNRVLKAAASVERGIGPVCIKYFA
jgi:hypothetical protein